MALSSPSLAKSLYDPIRRKHLAETPEERVRQRLLRLLLEAGYPAQLARVELSLKELPAALLGSRKPPRRRADILWFAVTDSGLKPLLLVECKQGPLLSAAEAQLRGYNSYVGAPFLALANEEHLWVIASDGSLRWEQLPFYDELKRVAFG